MCSVDGTEFKDESLRVTDSLKHIFPSETPPTPCSTVRPAGHGQFGATKVSELHLYLPSSLCEDEAAETEGMKYGVCLGVKAV